MMGKKCLAAEESLSLLSLASLAVVEAPD